MLFELLYLLCPVSILMIPICLSLKPLHIFRTTWPRDWTHNGQQITSDLPVYFPTKLLKKSIWKKNNIKISDNIKKAIKSTHWNVVVETTALHQNALHEIILNICYLSKCLCNILTPCIYCRCKRNLFVTCCHISRAPSWINISSFWQLPPISTSFIFSHFRCDFRTHSR